MIAASSAASILASVAADGNLSHVPESAVEAGAILISNTTKCEIKADHHALPF